MNVRQVEIFCAVMQTGSVAGAARLLAVSPPAVSRMLRHTEDQLGYALFERRAGRLVPTPEAGALYTEAEAALGGLKRVSSLAEGLRNGSPSVLRVAASPSFGANLLPHALMRFRRRSRQVVLDVNTTAHASVVERLLLRQADLGLSPFRADHPLLREELLGQFPMYAAIPEEWPLAREAVVGLQDLAALPLIGYASSTPIGALTVAHLEAHGIGRQPDVVVRYPMIACTFVDAGVGVAIVDAFMARDAHRWRIAFRPLSTALSTGVWMLRHDAHPLTQAGRNFERAIRQALDTYRTG
ncbi:LysR family transcriptional regulator [Roseomonas populi]|uniref:LysR substrate-binding domain-containing protein n=1 Tax=Roseomonas populi TaxID=3121582 RepID=A0ABT1XC27_9PROT|nr:LysR substrate-binding domain-containing protein [Roseomonas pecuniae]MCR0985687.1 LysR substrate-binding domain-containing protein [Roseomonas pecuniae]